MNSWGLALWAWRNFIRAQRGRIFLAGVFMAAEGAMLGLVSYMLKPMFDRIFVGQETGAIYWVGAVFLGLFTFRGLASITQKTLMAAAMQRVGADIQSTLLRHVMTLDAGFHQTHPPGMLIERVQGDVGAIKSNAGTMITGVVRDVVAMISLVWVALWVDPLWTLAALVGVPLLIVPSTMAQRFTRQRAREARVIAGGLSTRLDEVFHGINPVKLNRLEDYQAGRYGRLLKRRIRVETETAFGRALIPGLIDVMTGIGFIAVLFFGGQDIISGEKTVGEFMSFFTALALMFEPLRRLGAISGQWQATAASLERVYGLTEVHPSILSPARPAPPPDRFDIGFEDVHFAYEESPVLRGLSFTAEDGKTTALVGASGAGKSTVFNLLTRLVDPRSGQVKLGGRDVRDYALGDVRSTISVVTQDALLFDETLRENILLGKEDVPPDTLQAALDAAYVTEYLPKLSDGLNSPAGPRGSALSGGQRQRVAIARSLLKDAPVLLLDEATSALDAASERAVQDALDRLARGRTTLVIAHRLSTIQGADKIVVMDRGQVVDEGSHDELLARDGIYADLYRLQFRDPADLS